MIRRLLICAVMASSCFYAPASRASGIPVIDAAALTQMIVEFQQQLRDFATQTQQLNELRTQVQQHIEQLQELRAQVEAITGSRAISALLNGDFEQAARATLDHGVNTLVSEVAGGNIQILMDGRLAPGVDPEGIANQLLTSLGLSVPTLEELSRSDQMHDRGTATQAASGVVLSVQAQDAYGRANEAVGRLEELIGAIDAQEDIKASMDLNTRMTAELGFVLIDLIRMEAGIAHAIATEAIVKARDREAQSRFLVHQEGASLDTNN